MNKFIKDRKFKHLTFTDRLVISRMVDANMKVKDIAIAIGCSERTIYYELKRSTYEYLDSDTYKIFTKYNPDGAQARYEKNKRNKGFTPKILQDENLQKYIAFMIKELKYSPEAILFNIYNNNLEFDISIKSVNTIYKAIKDGNIDGVKMKDLPRKGKKKKKRKKVTIHKTLPAFSACLLDDGLRG